jgi:transcriptional regulator with XRE-family HTH domain
MFNRKEATDMDQKKVGSFLRELRKEKQLTQEQLAERFGVTNRSVSRWETGSNMPDLSILVELADFYDVDIRDIIDGERKGEDMNKEEKERLQLVADYAETEKNTLLMRLRIFSIVGLVSLIAGLVMLVLGGDNNLPVYDYLMGTLMGVSIGALLVAVFYSTGALENMRKRKRTLMKVLLVISILFLLGTFIAAIIASLLYIY